MKNRTCLALAAISATPLAALADELWRQDPQLVAGGYSSQDARNPGGLGWFSEVADNFAAAPNWTISSVEFWGGYGVTEPPNTIIHGATVRFYTDNAGRPGTRIFQQDVANTNETVFATTGSGAPLYHYSCTLSPAFTAPGAGQFWVSVVAIVDRGGTSTDPQWGWTQATSSNPPACEQWFFSPGNFVAQSGDVSFVLNGSVGGATCYPNCDNSTAPPILNVQDFSCFLTKYASGDPYANCDASTTPPVLNVQDFSCFLTKYASGCP